MTSVAHPRESFPLAPENGRIPHSAESPTGPNTRPWILRFARVPDATRASVRPAAVYDPELQVSVSLFGDPLTFAGTHDPTVPDGDVEDPPPLDEGAKD
ncbi:putative ATP-grasp-modified RiPP [Streptomyces sp. NPDC018019]|uniref:putative ATP-grasp-modified RiPP n=1 Tax=Streptomyces sp. NPDC018019 TaxID=3365030 RepID=UPI00379B4A91